MTQAEFLAAVHKLAEQLGRRLYGLVETESERVRAAALHAATAELRTSLGTEDEPAGEIEPAPEPEPEAAPRAQVQCKVCGELGHNARRHRKDVATDDQPAAQPPPAIPPPPLHGSIDSPPSRPRRERADRQESDVRPAIAHRVLRAVDPSNNVPPPGWTPESDRREEFADLSVLTQLRKAK